MSHRLTIRERLADLLTVEMGALVSPDNLHPQTGAWRTNVRLDVCRWQASLPGGFEGKNVPVICWDTMTDVLRYGASIEPDGVISLQVWALDPKDPLHREIRDWQRKAARSYRAGKPIPEPPHETFGEARKARDQAAHDACKF